MNGDTGKLSEPTVSGFSTYSRRFKPAVQLLLWVGGISLFIFVIGPLLARIPVLHTMGRLIEAHGIQANMYFYTEVEDFATANLLMINTMDYMPTGTMNNMDTEIQRSKAKFIKVQHQLD